MVGDDAHAGPGGNARRSGDLPVLLGERRQSHRQRVEVGVAHHAVAELGIDVIGGKWLTEINVTSPTGIVAIDRFNGTDTPGLIWDAIERRLGR